ncbi:MAG: ferrous iron transport protein B [Bacillota bacterium]|jgi:ferrous iron transport protein B
MKIRIALAGNPNSGKTTMFNQLTGSTQYVGNWPGVTVEKKEGKLRGHKDVEIVDLPGIYSLSPYTLEEVVSRNYLVTEKPDAIINIVDGTNIERNLYLTTQLMELGIPVIIALNMVDIVRKRGDVINIEKLSKHLGCEIIETTALKGEGCKEVTEKAISLVNLNTKTPPQHVFAEKLESNLSAIQDIIKDFADSNLLRWFAIKIFERDEKVMEQISFPNDIKERLEAIISSCEEQFDDDSESIITNERYEFINKIIKDSIKKKDNTRMTTSDKIDRVITNRFLAFPIFAGIIFLIYYVSISTVGALATNWVNEVLFGSIIPGAVENFLVSVGSADWLTSLILDGVIAGVGAVIGFLPLILILFFFLSILEDCGYMARIAFIMDRIFRKFGLSGKSFIPILIGTGCGVPGIMASRTIENERDRKMTIITTTFIPCGAKLPIIALIAGALFPESSLVAPSAYFIGIAAIILSGIILKKTKHFAGDPAPFVMELPAYHIPGAKGVLIHMWDRGKSFIIRAGTIIFVASAALWFLSSYSWSLDMVSASESILASIGNAIAIIFNPLGWGDWKPTVATITGLIAKENVVGTFGVLYGFEEVAENGTEYWANLQAAFTQLSAYSFLLFNLLCAPCIAAIGAIRREMGNVKWTLIAVAYQTGFAYFVSMVIFQLGLWFTGNGFSIGTAISIFLLIVFFYLLLRKDPTHHGINASKIAKAKI